MQSLVLKILVLLFSINYVFAQSDQIEITSGLYNNDIKIFFINDFDLTQSGNSPLLFWIKITNSYSNSRLVSLKLSIRYNGLASGETELASGETEPFDLQAGILKLNNQNLFSQTDPYRLKDYNINEDAADELINTILYTGKLPSGTYEFLLSVTDHNTQSNYSDDKLIIEISNPTTLDLITPGEPANSSELMEIYTTLPLFQWESDASEFRLKVCEKLSTNNSPEDVMSNEPRLETIVEHTTFQYPAVGAFPLEEGKTYFWKVVALTHSSSGPIEMESEIWGFKIANLSSGQTSALKMQVINYLKVILGDEVVDNLFKEGGELKNFTSTGIILKNGTSISLDELNILIDKFIKEEVKLNGYSVE